MKADASRKEMLTLLWNFRGNKWSLPTFIPIIVRTDICLDCWFYLVVIYIHRDTPKITYLHILFYCIETSINPKKHDKSRAMAVQSLLSLCSCHNIIISYSFLYARNTSLREHVFSFLLCSNVRRSDICIPVYIETYWAVPWGGR